jgi:hypothetical protein
LRSLSSRICFFVIHGEGRPTKYRVSVPALQDGPDPPIGCSGIAWKVRRKYDGVRYGRCLAVADRRDQSSARGPEPQRVS